MRRLRIAAPILGLCLTAGIGLTAKAAQSTLDRARDPVPLRGTALKGETGLRLLVAANPPFVLDVDTGRVIPSGIPALTRGTLWVVGVGGRAAGVVASSAWKRADIYAVRGREARVSPLGTGTNVWAAANGRAVWVQSAAARSRCTLRQMGLDGRQLHSPRAFPCATVSDPAGGSLGLVVRRTRVLDPRTGHAVLQTRWGIWAVAGTTLVLAGPGTGFTLLDGKTRAARRVPWPSILGFLDRPAVDPRGRFVALAFAVPAWRGGGSQVLDVWLLETRTGKLTQLPGMPAFVSLKRTSIAWSDDGRLVLLGESNGADVVAVWRPGQQHPALKTVQLPERSGGSDSFAILR
jgi:hypothetical protein